MKRSVTFTNPLSVEEQARYYLFRWELLRKPLGLPLGSEKYQDEDSSIHVTAFVDEQLIAVGKLSPSTFNHRTARISQVAVAESEQGKGYGRLLMKFLEARAHEEGYNSIILTARKTVLPFYQKLGYVIGTEAPSTLPGVSCVEMSKNLLDAKNATGFR